MIYTDTRDSSVKVTFKQAVMGGMNPATGGLYMPLSFPKLESCLLNKDPAPSFRDVAFNMAKPYVEGEIPDNDLVSLIQDAYPFQPKIVPLDSISYVLELFHGPTCAFKDFGARFMARAMSYFNKSEDTPLHILVATSGDTGSAVGSAFHGVSGLDVTILYPDGKISPLQEKQLSTFTGNVRALKVKGTFDDCQKLVKTAFTDDELRKKLRLSSANSINIARLLPQSFYYMYASLVVRNRCALDNKISNPSIIMVVPSGNFGNLTSGLIAKEMGAPIAGFTAATNSNRTIPDWIATGDYNARPSVETFANAMDVGAPSNYERIKAMYTLETVRSLFASYWQNNEGIIAGIKSCNDKTGYIIDPHGAIGWSAWNDIRNGAMEQLMNGQKNDFNVPGLTPNVPVWAQAVKDKKAVGIILETASPAKFGSIVKDAIGKEPPMPSRLGQVMRLPDMAVSMENDYNMFKDWLLANR
ncbi:threonine synthase [Treponema sp. Marseille-Q3903]|uniref:threonine synthase n=1 Tax=Treponema sp. Marseille-Q3903 TaxID=2766703 RepID=UPI001652A530|nr:threonine synthase [Treponema sp. Marseille-Q3903]MBC6713488.1 threonine synthase [Treponema sp. Marseille-Q3903]